MSNVCRHVAGSGAVVGLLMTLWAGWAAAQGKSGPRALDACGLVTKVELDGKKEGPGSVLDRTVILWQTDHGIARSHTMDNLPIITVGSAGGRIKTGAHINTPGDPSARVGLTLQQALGVPVSSWGALSNATSKTMTEILA